MKHIFTQRSFVWYALAIFIVSTFVVAGMFLGAGEYLKPVFGETTFNGIQYAQSGLGEVAPACSSLSYSSSCDGWGAGKAMVTFSFSSQDPSCSGISSTGSFSLSGPCNGSQTVSGLPSNTAYSGTVIFADHHSSTASYSGTTPVCMSMSFNATPTTISEGGPVILMWESEGATYCSGSGFSTGGALDGSVTLIQTESITYSIVCGNSELSQSQDIPITVLHPAATLDALPTFIGIGERATLEWTAENVEVCEIRDDANNLFATTGSGAFSQETDELFRKTVFTIVCTNEFGVTVSDSVTVKVPPTVEEF
jgi:hypothetical protein